MSSLAHFFRDDHRACDALWVSVEQAIESGDQSAAEGAWRSFHEGMERHLHMEEDELFPAFEEATGMHGGGPTFVMRQEHGQMRALMSQMSHLVETHELDEVLDQGDTLLMLIQQHNAKEEGMLYPMAEQQLGAKWEALRTRLPDPRG